MLPTKILLTPNIMFLAIFLTSFTKLWWKLLKHFVGCSKFTLLFILCKRNFVRRIFELKSFFPFFSETSEKFLSTNQKWHSRQRTNNFFKWGKKWHNNNNNNISNISNNNNQWWGGRGYAATTSFCFVFWAFHSSSIPDPVSMSTSTPGWSTARRRTRVIRCQSDQLFTTSFKVQRFQKRKYSVKSSVSFCTFGICVLRSIT